MYNKQTNAVEALGLLQTCKSTTWLERKVAQAIKLPVPK